MKSKPSPAVGCPPGIFKAIGHRHLCQNPEICRNYRHPDGTERSASVNIYESFVSWTSLLYLLRGGLVRLGGFLAGQIVKGALLSGFVYVNILLTNFTNPLFNRGSYDCWRDAAIADWVFQESNSTISVIVDASGGLKYSFVTRSASKKAGLTSRFGLEKSFVLLAKRYWKQTTGECST